jgi:hypothetical protein
MVACFQECLWWYVSSYWNYWFMLSIHNGTELWFNFFHALLELFCLGMLAFLILIVKVSEGNTECCYSTGILNCLWLSSKKGSTHSIWHGKMSTICVEWVCGGCTSYFKNEVYTVLQKVKKQQVTLIDIWKKWPSLHFCGSTLNYRIFSNLIRIWI